MSTPNGNLNDTGNDNPDTTPNYRVTRSRSRLNPRLLTAPNLIDLDETTDTPTDSSNSEQSLLISFDTTNNDYPDLPSSSESSESLNNLVHPSTSKSFKMTEISLETAIKLIPFFNGQIDEEIYPFINACEFAMSCIQKDFKPVLVKAITTKLGGKAFAVTQNREITDWAGLKSLLETAFCSRRTAGYLQLELNSTRQKGGESVQEYSGRVEKLFHDLCNVSVAGKKSTEAEAIRGYIKETTLTSYVEGLYSNIRQVIKSKNLTSLEEAIKESLEEEKLQESNKEARRLIHNNKPETKNISKYCSNCRKTNHNTNQCRFAKGGGRSQDTGQQERYSERTNIKKISCTYCKANGHTKEDCYKKKRANNRQNTFQQSSSGNGETSNARGERSAKEIKAIAQL